MVPTKPNSSAIEEKMKSVWRTFKKRNCNLGTVAVAHAKPTTRPNRDKRLFYVVGLAVASVGVRKEKINNPVHLVILDQGYLYIEEKDDHKNNDSRYGADSQERDNILGGKPAYPQHREPNDDDHNGGAQVRL